MGLRRLDSCSLNSYHLAPAALGPQVFGSWVFGLRVFGLRALETQILDPRSLGQRVGVRPRRQDTCMHASSIPASWASAAWIPASTSPTSWLLPPSGRRCLGRGFSGRGFLSRVACGCLPKVGPGDRTDRDLVLKRKQSNDFFFICLDPGQSGHPSCPLPPGEMCAF